MSRFEIQIKKEYAFTIDRNRYNDTAICTFQSPKISEVYCVVVRGYERHNIEPFFDVMIKDPEIILTSMEYIKDLWHILFPKHPFEDRAPQKYSFGFLPPKIFRFHLQPVSER